MAGLACSAVFEKTFFDHPLIAKLVPDHQAVLFAGGSYQEVRAAIGGNVALGTVKSRINRARVELTKLRLAELEKAA